MATGSAVLIGIISFIASTAVSIGITAYTMNRSEKFSEEQLKRSEMNATEQYKISIQDQESMLAKQTKASKLQSDLAEERSQAYNRAYERNRQANLYGSNNSRRLGGDE